jgi:hypothetical protein
MGTSSLSGSLNLIKQVILEASRVDAGPMELFSLLAFVDGSSVRSSSTSFVAAAGRVPAIILATLGSV